MRWIAGVLLGIAWMGARGAGATHVTNAGVPGQNSAEGRQRFVEDVVDAHPRVVLIYFGINDTVNEAKFVPEREFVANMAWMVDKARQNGIVPVISTIQHVDAVRLMQRHKAGVYGAEGLNGIVDRFNRALRKMAAEKGVAVSDFQRVLDEAGGPTSKLSADGVHLTEAGYGLMAEAFLRAVPGGLKAGDAVVCIGDSLTYGVPLRKPGLDSGGTYPAQLERRVR